MEDELFLKIYSLNEVKPVTLDDVRGGADNINGCCVLNFACDCNTDCQDNGLVPCGSMQKP